MASRRSLSPSSVSTWRQCPARWRYRYVENLPDPPGHEAVIGSFVHRVLEALLGEEPGKRSTDRAREFATRFWPDYVDDPDVRRLDLDEVGLLGHKRRIWAAVTGLWQLEDPTTIDVRATEHRLRTELDGVPFTGVVDRLDATEDGLVVTDYKSGKAPTHANTPDKLDQVFLYAAAVERTLGETPVRVQLHYLGDRTIDAVVEAAATDAAVARLRTVWDEIEHAQQTDEFTASTGPLCGWCPYVERCDVGLEEVRRIHARGRLRADAPAMKYVA